MKSRNRNRFLPAIFAAISCFSNTTNANEKANNQGHSTGKLIAVGLGSFALGGGIGAGVVDHAFRPDHKEALDTIDTLKTEITGLKSDNASLKYNLEQKEEKLKSEQKWRDDKISTLVSEKCQLIEKNNELQENLKQLESNGKITDEAQKELLKKNQKYGLLFDTFKDEIFEQNMQPNDEKGISSGSIISDCVSALNYVWVTDNHIARNTTMNLVCDVCKVVRILDCIKKYVDSGDKKYLEKIKDVKKFFNQNLLDNHSKEEMQKILDYKV